MTSNIWEFLRKPDGTYAVSHNGKLLSDSIPEKWFESQICEHYGFAAGNTEIFANNWIAPRSAPLT